MKRLPSLFASLLLLSSFGCREDNTDAEQPVDMTVATEQDMTVSEDLATNPVDLAGADLTPLPEPAEFIVLRVGDGTNALAGTAAPGFLERRKVSGGSLVGTPKALPTAVSGTNRILTITGTSTAEGQLSRSEDGRFVLVGGYDAAIGMATSTGTANRTIGRLDNTGTLDTSTSSDFLSNNSFRGVASNNGNDLWAAGASGIIYTTFWQHDQAHRLSSDQQHALAERLWRTALREQRIGHHPRHQHHRSQRKRTAQDHRNRDAAQWF